MKSTFHFLSFNSCRQGSQFFESCFLCKTKTTKTLDNGHVFMTTVMICVRTYLGFSDLRLDNLFFVHFHFSIINAFVWNNLSQLKKKLCENDGIYILSLNREKFREINAFSTNGLLSRNFAKCAICFIFF